MISFEEWISQFGVAEQTNIVWKLLNNPEFAGQKKFSSSIDAFVHDCNLYASVVCYNLYYAWCKTSDKFIQTEKETHTSSFPELNEVLLLKKKFEQLQREYKDLDFDSKESIQLSQLEIEISRLEKAIKMKKLNFILLKKYMKWILISNEDIAKVFVGFGLPVVYYESCFWWGYFICNVKYQPQYDFYERLKNLKIRLSDPPKIVIKEMYKKIGYEYKEDWETSPKYDSRRTADGEYLHNKNIILNADKGENKAEREVRLDLSNSFIRFIEDGPYY